MDTAGAGERASGKKEVIVAIPLYRETMSENEELSFRRAVSVLGKNHPVAAFAPEGMDLSLYTGIFPQLLVERFPAHFFHSVKDYSRLLLSEAFYERFASYEWLLICQLDVWVFRDDLSDWCRGDYDFIGAPIPATWERERDGKVPIIVGNGGFSLRRVSAFLRVLREGDAPMFSRKRLRRYVSIHLRGGHFLRAFVPLLRLMGIGNSRRRCLNILREQGACEDMAFTAIAEAGGLRVPSAAEAVRFALDGEYLDLFREPGRSEAPVGLHAWHREQGRQFLKQLEGKDPVRQKYPFVLSICIPTWNRAEILRKSLEALTAGTCFRAGRVEIVVSDNGSADATPEVCREFAARFPENFVCCRLEKGIDAHFNFQNALSLGRGEFLKLQTDYIYFRPGDLDRYVAFLEEHRHEAGLFLPGEEKSGGNSPFVSGIDEAVRRLSFDITSINALCLSRELYDSLEDPFREWRRFFPQLDIVFRLLARGERGRLLPHFSTVRQETRNIRNHAQTFACYLDLLAERVASGELEERTFRKEKRRLLFRYLIPYHFDFFHQYNVSRKPLPFLPYAGHFKKEWYFLPALIYIGFMWFCSNVIPIHQLLGRLKRALRGGRRS